MTDAETDRLIAKLQAENERLRDDWNALADIVESQRTRPESRRAGMIHGFLVAFVPAMAVWLLLLALARWIW